VVYLKYVPSDGAAIKLVVSAAVWYGIWLAKPLAKLVALPADTAEVALVAAPAVKLAAVPEKFVPVNVGLEPLVTS
jgi:hypothetical protein